VTDSREVLRPTVASLKPAALADRDRTLPGCLKVARAPKVGERLRPRDAQLRVRWPNFPAPSRSRKIQNVGAGNALRGGTRSPTFAHSPTLFGQSPAPPRCRAALDFCVQSAKDAFSSLSAECPGGCRVQRGIQFSARERGSGRTMPAASGTLGGSSPTANLAGVTLRAREVRPTAPASLARENMPAFRRTPATQLNQ
jgi:hypothetical protein